MFASPGLWIAVVTIVAAVLLTVLIRHRRHRTRTLAALAAERSDLLQHHPVVIASTADPQELANAFVGDPILRVGAFLHPAALRSLRAEAESNIPRMTRTYIPTHKKGCTLSYENIHRHAHGCLGFYHSPEVQRWVSTVLGMPVQPTPDQDQSSLSVLCYNEAGDHIHWHYDHNFYRGRHFTVLLSLANEAASGGVSQSTLNRKLPGGDEQAFDTSANSLVVFEGSRVLHRASPTAEGDLRIMLSMTFCTDPHTYWLKEFARRLKDTAFYGIRALWD
ncbi:MAG: 2OG-Fe(II) oxygenase [Planctomycetota bacterium]